MASPRRLVLAALLTAATVPAAAQMPSSPPQVAQETPVIWCHDPARGLVSRKRAGDCDGTVVGDDEARAIRDARTRAIRDRFRPAPPLIPGLRRAGSGTGFFVSAHGHAITNHHVIAGCGGVSVTPADGKPSVATVIARDPVNDLALLKTALAPPAFAAFREPDRLQPGEAVMVVGYPLHGMVAIRPIFVTGHLHDAMPMMPRARFPVRIDIRKGNSGSPVLDRTGRVIGVITSKIDTAAVYAATGRTVRDIGIAVGGPAVRSLLRQNGVMVPPGTGGAVLDEAALFARARTLVAQIGCWR